MLSCYYSRYRLVRCIASHCITHGGYFTLIWINLRFCCRRYGWSGEAFVSGQVLLNNNFFLQFFMDNLQLDQLQTACVAEDLFGLGEGSAFLECDNFFTKDDISFLLNAVCSG